MTRKISHSIRLLLPVSLIAFLGSVATTAQTTSPGTGLERKSKPNELQVKAKPIQRKGVPMNPGRPVTAPGSAARMEQQLARPQETSAGERQPTVNPEQAAKPTQGRGEQQRPAERPTSAQTHLHLVLRVSAAGKAEVVTATEVPGPASLSDDVIGDTFSVVAIGNQTIAVQSIPDPFETRSFAPRDSPQQGHYIGRTQEALVVVKVPDTSLARTNLQSLTIRLYKLNPGTTIQKINPLVFNQLNQQKKLVMRIDIPAAVLAPQIRVVGRKLEVQP